MKLLETKGENYKLREEYLNLSSSINELRDNLYEVLFKKLTDQIINYLTGKIFFYLIFSKLNHSNKKNYVMGL